MGIKNMSDEEKMINYDRAMTKMNLIMEDIRWDRTILRVTIFANLICLISLLGLGLKQAF